MSRGWLIPALCCLPWLICALMLPSSAQRVDCRKFVFAPLCRGVAAKRAYTGEEDFYLQNDDKVDSLDSAVLGSYPTVPPADKEPDETRSARARKDHSRINRQPFPTQTQPWKTRDDQGLKIDTLYDWYLDNRKRTRDPEAAYDY